MKHLRTFGLAAIAAAALTAWVGSGTASATQLTCTNPPGTKVFCPSGTHISLSSSHDILQGPLGITVTCTHSTVNGKTTNAGSINETVKVNLEGLVRTTCANTWHSTTLPLKTGTLEVHTDPNDSSPVTGNGILTSTGAEVTTEQTSSGLHCIYTTNNTQIGTVTGSSTTKGKAVLDITATIPRTGGRSGAFCGASGHWTGSYTITSPEWMDVD